MASHTQSPWNRLFHVPQFPPGDYRALQWARERLDGLARAAGEPEDREPTNQRDVLILGIRLVTLMLQGGLDLEGVLRVGQEETVRRLLVDFRALPPREGEGSVLPPR